MPPRNMAEDLWGNGTDVLLTGSSGWNRVHTREPHVAAVRSGLGLPSPSHMLGEGPLPRELWVVETALRIDNRGKAKAPPILPEPRGPLMAGARDPTAQHSQATSLSWPHDSVYLS